MAACQNCHLEFDGRPWRYAANGRVHVDCTPPPARGHPNRTGTMSDRQLRYVARLAANPHVDTALRRRVTNRIRHADQAEGSRMIDHLIRVIEGFPTGPIQPVPIPRLATTSIRNRGGYTGPAYSP